MQTTRSNNRLHARLQGNRIFFPAAALYAALVLPLSLLAMTTPMSWPAGLVTGHGYEMLFGFGLALVAGYLLGPRSLIRLLLLFVLWLAASLTAIVSPGGLISGSLNVLFALAIAWHVVPKLFAAKKWRNRIIGPLVFSLFLLPAIYMVALYLPALEPITVMNLSIVLFAFLMVFMGGRIIAPAVAGEFYRRDTRLDARVQPRIEAALIVLLAGAALAVLLPYGNVPAGVLLVAAGLLTAVRLWRWQIWRCSSRVDLIGLGVGYAWLAAGIILTGLALISETGLSNAWHFITIGALGTLSIGVIARTHFSRVKRDIADYSSMIIVTTGLIAAATLARGLVSLAPAHMMTLIWGAAACWSMAYLLLLVLLMTVTRPDNNESGTRAASD